MWFWKKDYCCLSHCDGSMLVLIFFFWFSNSTSPLLGPITSLPLHHFPSHGLTDWWQSVFKLRGGVLNHTSSGWISHPFRQDPLHLDDDVTPCIQHNLLCSMARHHLPSVIIASIGHLLPTVVTSIWADLLTDHITEGSLAVVLVSIYLLTNLTSYMVLTSPLLPWLSSFLSPQLLSQLLSTS